MAKIVVGPAAKKKVAQLKRYITKLGLKKGNRLAVGVLHAKHLKRGRTLQVGVNAAKYISGLKHKVVNVNLTHAKKLVATVKNLPKRSLYSKVLALESSQVGYKETPVNRTKYGKWFGFDGVAWCAIFQSWGLTLSGRPFHYASVPAILADARARRNGLSTIPYGRVASAIKAGHVVLACYDWPGESPGVPDHVEFVVKPLSGSSFATIGGNTSDANASNGGEVMRRTRYTVDVEAFVLVT